MSRRICIVCGLSLGLLRLAGAPPVADHTKGTLLIANKGDRSLGLVDPRSGKQVPTVPEGGVTGHEVTASADGKLAYVPVYGDSGVGKPGTDGRNMVVIDLGQRKVVGTVDFGHG